MEKHRENKLTPFGTFDYHYWTGTQLISSTRPIPTKQLYKIRWQTMQGTKSQALVILETTTNKLIEFKGTNDRHAIVHPDCENPKEYRITYFDNNGFSGHNNHNTKLLAIESVLNEGYQPGETNIDKTALTTEFQNGIDFSYLIQLTNQFPQRWHQLREAFKLGGISEARKCVS